MFACPAFAIQNQWSFIFKSSQFWKPRSVLQSCAGCLHDRRAMLTLSQGEPTFPSLRIIRRYYFPSSSPLPPNLPFHFFTTTKLRHILVITLCIDWLIDPKNWVQILPLPLSSFVLLGKSFHLSSSWFPHIYSKAKRIITNNNIKGWIQRCSEIRYVKRPNSLIFFST